MSITSKAVTRMVLDMGKVDVQKSVAFTKGDVNRRWEVTLVDNGVPFELPRNWTVALSAIKPDETSIYNGCVVEHGKITYDFASGEQIATSEGTFAAQFDVFDETGEPVCSPRVWIHILPVSRNLAPIESDPQFTVVRQFLERAGELEADIKEIRAEFADIVKIGKVSVSRTSWKGSPIRASLYIPDLPRNSVTMLYPADALSRAQAAHAEITAQAEDTEGSTPYIALEAAGTPTESMTFVYCVIKSERTGRPMSAAAVMGLGSGDGEPGSLKYVSDGNGRVTVFGKMVETVDYTARNQSSEAVKEVGALRAEVGEELSEIREEISESGSDQVSRIEVLEGQVADLLYEPMTIQNFSNNVNTAEMGSTVRSVSLSWVFNKAATTATLDGEAIDPSPSGGMGQSGLTITANKTWTLKAVDERGAEAVKTTGITFLNGVYYGAAAAPEAIDSAFILELSEPILRSTKLSSFTVNAGDGQYIYYCVPKRFGTCSFTVGGVDGGFDAPVTVSFKNASGYTEDYYVYRSTNAALGATTVGVK